MPDRSDLIETNDHFYRLMRAGDLEGMADFWSRDRLVSCTHPGRAMLIGREAVMGSWRAILTSSPPSIWPGSPMAVISGSTAFVLCIERVDGSELMASNGFVVEDGAWRMLNHQAAFLSAESEKKQG
ncbi:MAG: nuclear transport factor 2 family protein [Pseudomonadota bacterium]